MSRWRYLDPMWLIDLYDATGKPDAQKILPYIVVLGTFWCHVRGHPLDSLTVTVLGAIAFGPRVFGMFLRAGKWTASAQTSVQVDTAAIAAIAARRKDRETEPAP